MLTKQDKQYLEEKFVTKEFLEANYYDKKYLDAQFYGIFVEFTRTNERIFQLDEKLTKLFAQLEAKADRVLQILEKVVDRLDKQDRRIYRLENPDNKEIIN